jgi:predicted protein tyrosine phosphatase
MSRLVVCPLSRVAETAVAHGARSMISLLAEGQQFHRPAVIAGDRHLVLGVNDISVATDMLILPQEAHVAAIIDFVRTWDGPSPLLLHCWMGISRSPAAALVAALALDPDQDDDRLAQRLRAASPSATPNARIVAIGDEMLDRRGALVAAATRIGRGADAYEGNAFTLGVTEDAAS